MARRGARMIHLVAAWAFVACLVAQVFLAGLGVFDDSTSFVTHRNFGYLIGWFVLVLLVAAIVGRLGRRQIGLAALVLVLFAFQSVFVAMRQTYPAIAALHPLNGFVILLVTIVIARDAWLARRHSLRAAAMTPEAARSEAPA